MPPDSHAPPQREWLRDALERSWEEVRTFARAAAAFTWRPGGFAVEWLRAAGD